MIGTILVLSLRFFNIDINILRKQDNAFQKSLGYADTLSYLFSL